jgi:hypothetical protein
MWVSVAMAAAVFLFLVVRGPSRRSAEPALPVIDVDVVGDSDAREPALAGAFAD